MIIINNLLSGKYNKAIAAVLVGILSFLLPIIGVNLDPQVRSALQTILSAVAVWSVANKG